eukprot:CAMPEP_0114521504 /NCGR_PEP_ID=MMETSP0109-20121206/20219_1 /TAXON_ID=29199 /ORGANISM="Chlorarachnion reptans, Strain CCCM449" /LENGTH=204 /DNA_ID=CAMNT_0001702609 /DNA_START=41 /DNA_END=655 /DNA_ORIENTATION=-
MARLILSVLLAMAVHCGAALFRASGKAAGALRTSNRMAIRRLCDRSQRSSRWVASGKIPVDMVERLKRTNALGPYRGWMDTMDIIEPDKVDSMINNDGYTLLDVRPTFEVKETPTKTTSVHVPLYEKAEGDDTKIQQFLAWAQRQTFTEKNEGFLDQVKEAFPDPEAKLLVGCEGGVRSILAMKELQNAGFKNLVWIGGGMGLK